VSVYLKLTAICMVNVSVGSVIASEAW